MSICVYPGGGKNLTVVAGVMGLGLGEQDAKFQVQLCD